MNNSIKDRLETVKEWILDHMKIVMPVILLVCVLITVLIAVNANKKAAAEVEAQAKAAETEAAAIKEDDLQETQEYPLEENAYPAVNSLMNAYYEALAAGDMDRVISMNQFVDDTERIRIEAISKYIESYPELRIYTKPGPVENSYLVYAYSKVRFSEYDQPVPGMQAFYVCTDENGNCYINEGEDNSVVTEYIRNISLQDDVVELNNKVAVEYNELVENDEELAAFLVDLSARIDVSVGEALARAEAGETASSDASEQGQESTDAQAQEEGTEAAADEPEEVQEPEPAETVITVRATDVVNIRSSDSETADKLGKAQIGDEFPLLEERGNGWSRITFEGEDAFIKSEFLEAAEVEQSVADAQENDGEDDEATLADTENAGSSDTVTVIENVNIRKSASENGEKLGLAYIGEKLELVMKQADGWTKVKYKGETAYVKSEYVE